MKKLEAYNEMIEDADSFLNKDGSLSISKFVRSNYDNIKKILKRGFYLSEITENLSRSLNVDIKYQSFWTAMKRHSERIKRKNSKKENFKKKNVVAERKKEVLTKKLIGIWR